MRHYPGAAARAGSNGASGGHSLPVDFSNLTTPLLGAHQLANQTTAVAACAELASQGVAINESTIRRGLAAVRWPARLEVLQVGDSGDAAVVVNSAHTVESAHLLCDALAEFFPGRRLQMILGVSNDKDAHALLAAFAARGVGLHLTRSRHPRALDPHELASLAAGLMDEEAVTIYQSVRSALAGALRDAHSGTVVCVTGSLFVAAEGREAWLDLYPDAFPADDWVHEAEPMAPEWQVSQVLGPVAQQTLRVSQAPANPKGLEAGRAS